MGGMTDAESRLVAMEAHLASLQAELDRLRAAREADHAQLARLLGAHETFTQQFQELRQQLAGFGERLERVEEDLASVRSALSVIVQRQEAILQGQAATHAAWAGVQRWGKWAVAGLAVLDGLVTYALK